MLDMEAAIKYLKSELRRVNDAINNFESIACDQYADRKNRANQKLAKARCDQQNGAARTSDRFLISPPPGLDPDIYLWLR